MKIQRLLALIAFLEDALTGPQIRLDSFPCCRPCESCHGLCGSYSGKDDLGHYFRLADNCPESPGPTFIEVIIAQFYASEFWTATLPELLATYKTKRWFPSLGLN